MRKTLSPVRRPSRSLKTTETSTVCGSDTCGIENLSGWLTTVVGGVCLEMLRSRRSRREEPLDSHVPDPILSRQDRIDPDHEVLLADSVGLALLVVPETLAPAERLAFVLHDMFAVPFDEIAAIVGRSPAATGQLASRSRRRVQGAAVPDTDVTHQRAVVDAFIAAARDGDIDGLITVLHPDIVLRSDGGCAASRGLGDGARCGGRGRPGARLQAAPPVRATGARQRNRGSRRGPRGQPSSVMAFTVRNAKFLEIDLLVDPERLRQLDLTVLRD
jgi:hypothetical protein